MADNFSMIGAVLKVNPQVMYAKSYEVGKILSEMRRNFESMQTLVRNSERYWQGQAGDLHRNTYDKHQKQAEYIFRRLQEHVDELKQMGQNYEQAEQAAISAVENLSSDVIL